MSEERDRQGCREGASLLVDVRPLQEDICDTPDRWIVDVTDLKQYEYCPRIPYYRYCLDGVRPVTYKMEAGLLAHESEQVRMRRRSLKSLGIEDGRMYHDIRLVSQNLRLSGRVDVVIITEIDGKRQGIPIDFKDSRRAGPHWKLQLAAYGLLLEEQWKLPVDRGFLYLIPLRHAEEVRLTKRLKQAAVRLVREILEAVEAERTPQPTSHRGRCVDCEFQRFCNDVF